MPVAAVLTALSAPVMAVLAFGQAAEGDGPELLGAALVGLAVGIPVYGGFLLLTRVAYALGRQPHARRSRRWPSLSSGAVGMLAAAAGHRRTDTPGARRLAHTAAYAVGGDRAGGAPATAPSASSWHVGQLRAGGDRRGRSAGWRGWAMEAWAPEGRVATLLAIVVLGGLGAGGVRGGAAGCSARCRRARPMSPAAAAP